MSITYLDPARVTAVRTSEPPANRSQTGYGRKIASPWELQISRRWHRVYTVIYSNSGSLYVIVKKQHLYLGGFDPREHPVQVAGSSRPRRRRRW